ncbi:MAG: T9SS type A sorting domain-containing protein [Bacteroidota bacterium]|nr:T9SS type A sorting domain-containing protein [Bacteroidota bacterium]
MKNKIYLSITIVITYFFSQNLFSQDIKGTITTTYNQPVQNCRIEFVNKNIPTLQYITLTDSLGRYKISITTGVDESDDNHPDGIKLYQNYPNPFSEKTVISYKIPKHNDVTIKVYNILGQEVRALITSEIQEGFNNVIWDGKDNFGKKVSSGIYFYKIKSDDRAKIKKMLYLEGITMPAYPVHFKNFENSNSKANDTTIYIVRLRNIENTTYPRVNDLTINKVYISGDTTLNIMLSEAKEWEYLGLGKPARLKLIDDYLFACAGKDGLYRLNLILENSQWEYLGFADTTYDYRGVMDIYYHKPSNEIFVGIRTAQRDVEETGIFRSSDFGINWTPSDSGIIFNNLRISTKVDRFLGIYDPNVIIVNISWGTYRSIDNGRSWLRGGVTWGEIKTMKNDVKNNNIIWIGGETPFMMPYLSYSTNFGDNWISMFLPEPYDFNGLMVNDIAIDPIKDSTMYIAMIGHLIRTTDHGANVETIFDRREDGMKSISCIEINPENGDEFFAAGSRLYHTTDAGETLNKILPPEGSSSLSSLTVDWEKRIIYTHASKTGYSGIFKRYF